MLGNSSRRLPQSPKRAVSGYRSNSQSRITLSRAGARTSVTFSKMNLREGKIEIGVGLKRAIQSGILRE
jgi:hypothetical protein